MAGGRCGPGKPFKPSFQGEALRRRSCFERRRLVVGEFDHGHGQIPLLSLFRVKDMESLVTIGPVPAHLLDKCPRTGNHYGVRRDLMRGTAAILWTPLRCYRHSVENKRV